MHYMQRSFNPLFIRSVFLLMKKWQSVGMNGTVSIPYSSGQCFFSAGNLNKGGKTMAKFQSLIHQVSVSFSLCEYAETFLSSSFNPLFIRSVFLFLLKVIRRIFLVSMVSIPYSSGQCFFLFPTVLITAGFTFIVSIPYSSGQCFFYMNKEKIQDKELVKFQSLIHQVSVSF